MAVKEKIRSIYREIKDAFKRYAVTVSQVGFSPLNHPKFILENNQKKRRD